MSPAKQVRLQKFLAAAGVCSRRQGEAHITAGRVRVNGEVVTKLGTCVDPAKDRVLFDGKPVAAQKRHVYLAVNKPRGVLTTCSQPGRRIILDLVDIPERVFPIGRLDKDSDGLVLLTSDGRLHHRLLHPSFDHEKEYDVTVRRPISDGDLEKLAAGMPVLGSKTRPAKVTRVSPVRFRMVLKEGKNRQIRRMVRQVGNKVSRLTRTRMANVRLDNLAPGKSRPLTANEVRTLLDSALGKGSSP